MFSRIPLIFLLSASLLFLLSEGSRGSKSQGRRKSEPAVLSGGSRGSTPTGRRKSEPSVLSGGSRGSASPGRGKSEPAVLSGGSRGSISPDPIPWTTRKCHGENVDMIQADKYTSGNVTLQLFNKHYKSGTELKCTSPPPYFDAKKKTKVVMHGFNSNGNFMANDYKFVEAYQTQDVNLIIVDWSSKAQWSGLLACATSRLTCGSWSVGYAEAAACAIEVGKYLAGCLNQLKVDANDLHLFGHSLGAHGVGMTGRVMTKKPKRVTGMDPAGPGFIENLISPYNIERLPKEEVKRIGKKSGQFVDIIHTNGLQLGILERLGHVDYYVNGGKVQPKCSQVPGYSETESHGYAVRVLVASLRGTQTQKFWKCIMGHRQKNCFRWNVPKGTKIKKLIFDVSQEEKNGLDGTYYLHTPNTDCY